MKREKCSTPRCRGPVDIIVLGKPLCDGCWQKRCEEREQDWLKQQGVRHAPGQ